jgi:hypothetical protein
MLDNDFPAENYVCLRALSLAEHGGSGFARASSHREQAMQNPQPFIVSQNGKPLFTVHAYSVRQARDIVVARLSDTAGVTVAAARDGVAQ